MTFYVYIIKSSKNGRHYIGYTSDLKQRVDQHNKNRTKSLKNQGPFRLIHKEEYENIFEARRREKQIKRYKGGRAFKELIGVKY